MTGTENIFKQLLSAGNSRAFMARNHKGEIIAIDYLNDFYNLSNDQRVILDKAWKIKYHNVKFHNQLLVLLQVFLYILSPILFFYGYSKGNWLGGILIALSIALIFITTVSMDDWFRESRNRVKDVKRIYKALRVYD